MTGEEDCESGVSRREAVKTGTFATAGLLGLSSLGAESARAQSSEPRIRLGDEWVIDPDGDDFSIEHSSLGVSFVWDESAGYWVPGGGGFDMDGGDIVDDGTTVYDASTDTVGDGSTSADHQSIDTDRVNINGITPDRLLGPGPIITDESGDVTTTSTSFTQVLRSGGALALDELPIGSSLYGRFMAVINNDTQGEETELVPRVFDYDQQSNVDLDSLMISDGGSGTVITDSGWVDMSASIDGSIITPYIYQARVTGGTGTIDSTSIGLQLAAVSQ
jgi:hypothetical protein